jgi:benzoylformate decarboxylase
MANVTGKEALMQILHHEGVEYVFGIPGATETHFVDVMEDHPEIKYILCLHELTAVGMAEGYARTSGKVGFLNLHTGTGLAAGMPMLSNAYYGGVPMIVTVGQQDTRLLASEPAMSDNLVRIAGPFVKWATEIIHTEDIPMLMRRAFKIATHPPTGPVMVSLPSDVLANDFDFEYVPSCHSFTKLHPDDEAIKKACDLLTSAQNPAIIVEDGITKCEALVEVVRFAEQIGARVYQPWMSDVNFPVDHPQYMGDIDVTSLNTRDMLEKVDVLVVIGALFFQQPIYLPKPLLPPTTRVIQIDDNPWQIAKNFPISCNIEGHIKVALNDLNTALDKKVTAATTKTTLDRINIISQEKQTITKAFEDKIQQEKTNVPISATRLIQEIKDAIKPGTLIVDDCWSYSAILRKMLPLSELRSYQRARGGGSIGGGLPAALGTKLASPDRPVVCISGDGSALWGIQSLWVASRYNIPVTIIIISNAAYRQVRLMKRKILGDKAIGRNLGTELLPPRNDFCKIAEGMGLIARKVERPEQLKEALRQALGCNKPNLVDIAVDAAL